MFVNVLYDYIESHGEISYAPADHHGCRLGKWYDSGVGRQEYSSMPTFNKLEAPHKAVHGTAVELIGFDASNMSDSDVANLCSKLNKINQASDDVCKDLDLLIAEKDAEIDEQYKVA
ncbi:MAG: CZB domain-containing protein [Deferribacteraceae bacterium]|nr:CZB domain-containing protein [Deferribacteraceae bacterium]